MSEPAGRKFPWAAKGVEPPTTLDGLLEYQTTVSAYYWDFYCEWEVRTDPKRNQPDMCKWCGWGETISEAIANLERTTVP